MSGPGRPLDNHWRKLVHPRSSFEAWLWRVPIILSLAGEVWSTEPRWRTHQGVRDINCASLKHEHVPNNPTHTKNKYRRFFFQVRLEIRREVSISGPEVILGVELCLFMNRANNVKLNSFNTGGKVNGRLEPTR